MGCCAAGGPVTSFNMAAMLGAVLDFAKKLEIVKKMLKIGTFFMLDM